MGRTVINETENKQTVILNDSPEGVEGGYFDADMEWHNIGADEQTFIDGFLNKTFPSGVITSDATTIEKSGIYYRPNITEVHLPKCTYLGDDAISYNDDLKKIIIEGELTHVGSYAFRNNPLLEEIRTPNNTAWYGGQALANNPKLKLVDIGYSTSISLQNMSSTVLDTLILRSETVVTLNYETQLNNTPFKQGGTGGKVYVPSALVESYKTANKWSVFYGYGTMEFIPIEGSEYEL